MYAEGIRAYRVDRLSAVRPGTRMFEARLPTDLAHLFTFSQALTAELRLSARFGTFVKEHFRTWHRNTDGTFSAERNVLGSADSFVSWVLGFGGDATITKPEELGCTLLERAADLRGLYASDPGRPT